MLPRSLTQSFAQDHRGGRRECQDRGPFSPIVAQSPRDLTHPDDAFIFVHMRTTLNIDDGLLKRAAQLIDVTEKTALVGMGPEALIALESPRRLARLGGTRKALRPIRRRRSAA